MSNRMDQKKGYEVKDEGISPVSRANRIGAEIVSNFPAAAQNASSLLYGLINAEDERNVALGCLK